MTDTSKYLQAVQDAIGDAKQSPWGFNLLTQSPGKDSPVGKELTVSRSAGGVITIYAEEGLYRELEPELTKLVRVNLGISRRLGWVELRFHHY
jgi:hypothetical protein